MSYLEKELREAWLSMNANEEENAANSATNFRVVPKFFV